MTRTMLLTLSVALAAPATAAPVASRSASQIVCELTGDCDGTAGGAQAGRPAEAAFSFTRSPGGAAAAKPPKAAPTRAVAATSPKRPAAVSSGIDMRISFANGSAEMTPQGRAEAAQFAKAMMMPQLASRRFAVEGHTNSVGDRDYNRDLSQRRAAAVSAYLVSQGIAQDRREPRGLGFDAPLPGRDAAAPANRRVQFVPLG